MAEVVRSTIAVHIFHLRNPTDQKNRYYSSVLSNNRNISSSSSSFDIKKMGGKGGLLKIVVQEVPVLLLLVCWCLSDDCLSDNDQLSNNRFSLK